MAQIDPVTGLPMSGLKKLPYETQTGTYTAPSFSGGGGSSASVSAGGGGSGGGSGGGGGGGFNLGQIDFMGLIQKNPYFQQAKALLGDPSAGELGAQGVQNINDLQNAFKSSIIKYGYAPDTSKFPGVNQSYLSQFAGPDVQNLASQNQFSVKALMDRSQGDTIRDTHAELASRGLLDSGEQNYLLGEGDTGRGTAGGRVGFQYAQQQDQDMQNLMQYLSGAQSSYTTAENARLAAYQQALYNAMQQEIGMMQNMGVPDYGGGDSSYVTQAAGGGGGGGLTPFQAPPGFRAIEDLPGAITKIPTGATVPVRIPAKPAAPAPKPVVKAPPPPPKPVVKAPAPVKPPAKKAPARRIGP